jgi:class 3 adenylate cyclase
MCGRKNADDARFCSGCGEKLSVSRVEEIRKTATDVFSDLVGSTSLGEKLDPESVRRTVGRYFDEARLAADVLQRRRDGPRSFAPVFSEILL